jgi:hypothetical protein
LQKKKINQYDIAAIKIINISIIIRAVVYYDEAIQQMIPTLSLLHVVTVIFCVVNSNE